MKSLATFMLAGVLIGIAVRPAKACGSCVLTPVSYTGGIEEPCNGTTQFVDTAEVSITKQGGVGAVEGAGCTEAPGPKASNVACVEHLVEDTLGGTGTWTSTDSSGSVHDFTISLFVTCYIQSGGRVVPETYGWASPTEQWKCS